jgi:hypothetical protein
MTSHAVELWALRSLGDEVLVDGNGGGFPWLQEHLVSHYNPQWYSIMEGSDVDASILSNGNSRWYNYYVESLGWLARNIPIDGLYLDDVSCDRTVLKRMRKVLENNRPDCRIDLHSNTGFSIGPANQYAEFFPYIDSIWFGESFDYEAMTPDQWLIETSGIPFGLMGDMLQGGGNRWRGMIYGMTKRGDPQIWKLWDDFGIMDARMVGYWEKDCPVRTDKPLVKATAYVGNGKTLIVIASWEKETVECHLQINWKALGFPSEGARLSSPEIAEFQPGHSWKPNEAIVVRPNRGWLIIINK